MGLGPHPLHDPLWKVFQWEVTVQFILNSWLWKTGTLTYNKHLLTDVNKYQYLTNNLSIQDKTDF